ncbi:MAG: methyltransferase domain-containing protein [Elusimicrobia bacterium]|nr:methyltransferase domain-containing protein [Elusimicrobiota bacterium]
MKLDTKTRPPLHAGDVVTPFEEQVKEAGRYHYHSRSPVASELAQKRLMAFVKNLWPVPGRRAIDIGCGDGECTARVLGLVSPDEIVAIDPARAAVESAEKRITDPRITWQYASCYQIPYPDDRFDVALLMGVLHHVGDPAAAIAEALRVAPRVVVVEPNGYNPGLMLVNEFVPSARHFGEKAYWPRSLRAWVRAGGGRIVRSEYGRLVSHHWSAGLASAVDRYIQPAVEAVPWARNILCSEYAFLAERT